MFNVYYEGDFKAGSIVVIYYYVGTVCYIGEVVKLVVAFVV